VIVDFLIVGLVLFLVVRTLNRFKHKPAPTEKECPQCLEKIHLHAKRCRYCTSELATA
jgi:large conductance mechanosensitive channel